MKGIKEIELDGEIIKLKKSKIFGWGIINPIKEDGKINWKNLLIGGSWIKFIFLVLMILFIIGASIEYSRAVEIANSCIPKNIFGNILG